MAFPQAYVPAPRVAGNPCQRALRVMRFAAACGNLMAAPMAFRLNRSLAANHRIRGHCRSLALPEVHSQPVVCASGASRRLRYGRLLPRCLRLLPCRANGLHCAPSPLRSRGRPRRRHSRASFTVAHFAFCSPRSDRKALQSLSLAATLPSFAFPLRGSANAPSGLTAERMTNIAAKET